MVVVCGAYIGGRYKRFIEKPKKPSDIRVVFIKSHKKIRVKLKSNKNCVSTCVSRYRSIVSRSKRKRLNCDITIELVGEIINKPCEYCGSHDKLSEIDRKDNSKGYTKDNIVPACRRCNTIKNNVVTYDEMMQIVEFLGWRCHE